MWALALAWMTCLVGATPVELARLHAEQAQPALAASSAYLHGWMAKRDPETGLIPQNLKSNIWTPHNSAADNYAFMVLTAFFLDRPVYDGPMREMLDSEMLRTSRVRSLPDWLSLDTDDFAQPEVDLTRVIFGASEYCKDGLLPLAEMIGPSPWFERLRVMANDLRLEAPVQTQFGPIPSNTAEVNGNMLQVWCRLHSATGDPQLLEAALRIADAYFLEVLPGNGGIPCHVWDFVRHEAQSPALRLNDHGNEIMGGLAEAFVLAKHYRPDKAQQYEPVFRRMLDRVAEIGLRNDGLWCSGVSPDGKVTAEAVPDTWGYVCNAYYTAWLVLGEERYRNIVLGAMDAITGRLEWGGADAIADCAESGIILLNREDRPATVEWLDRLEAGHVTRIQADGIVEGWHGDGNSARTWLLYAMMKSQGARVAPWRKDVLLGGAVEGDVLTVSLRVGEPWEGTLYFDHPRHRNHMGLPLNYPRLNEWPEWWTAEPGALYELKVGEETKQLMGYRLHEGLPISLAAGDEWLATLRPISRYPHAGKRIELLGPEFIRGPGTASAEIVVRNPTSATVQALLNASVGELTPTSVTLEAGGETKVEWNGSFNEDAELIVTAAAANVFARGGLRIPMVGDPNLLDLCSTAGTEAYQDVRYTWLREQTIERELCTRGETKLVLRLLWGSKNDERHAVMQVGDKEYPLAAGGYDGFRPLDVPITLDQPVDKLKVRIAWDGKEKPAFIAALRLLKG